MPERRLMPSVRTALPTFFQCQILCSDELHVRLHIKNKKSLSSTRNMFQTSGLGFPRTSHNAADALEIRDVVAPANIADKLEELTVCLDTLNKSVSDHASDTGQAAVQQMQGVCSDQMLKRQLQSLKASFINLGQKESFAEAIKTFSKSSDFKPETDRAAGAVESAEEDLKDLKKINQQEEQEAALSQESARASWLESEIAAAQTDCTDTEAAMQAQLDDIAVLKAEVAQLQAIKEDQVKEADSHLQRSNKWLPSSLPGADP
ncbi:hypothetical protein DUNSADRAFT_5358 [Dunaliella salina]|uniref:Uncharacterized protein n=1 Tax=Dunaliella salina TaxID=3046 RepID=A0ABQ7GQE5_DUNSA|nr:hypothetical protein DUNSADRAFT_5358 [Dunaliella salina]|eukprot:KAF5836818.1 hypothetical protein DUNSADRAFT_5358 [Dunaliella salina]